MINKGITKCKIDRVDGIVKFKLKRNENDVLNDWNRNIHSVLDLVDNTCNLIKREEEMAAM